MTAMPFKDPVAEKAYQAAYREKNRPSRNKLTNDWYHAKSDKLEYNRKTVGRNWDKFFGWDPGSHAIMVAKATHCDLCGKPFDQTKTKYRLHTDHNHKTKEFRGFVHHGCNVAIAFLKEDPETCLAAARYLQAYPPVIISSVIEETVELQFN